MVKRTVLTGARWKVFLLEVKRQSGSPPFWEFLTSGHVLSLLHRIMGEPFRGGGVGGGVGIAEER